METIYYDKQYLQKILESILDKQLVDLEYCAIDISTDPEIYKQKYRLLYGREFEELEINYNEHIAKINMLSNDNKIHLRGSMTNLMSKFSTLEKLDVLVLDTSEVTDMAGMFDGCNLENLITNNSLLLELYKHRKIGQ